jgi:hypothetical protein
MKCASGSDREKPSAGVRFIGQSDPQSVKHDGALLLGSGVSLEADCVVAVPELRGPRITGVPTGADVAAGGDPRVGYALERGLISTSGEHGS